MGKSTLAARAVSAAVHLVRDGLYFVVFATTAIAAAATARFSGRPVALGLFVSRSRAVILRHAAPGARRFRARLLKAPAPAQRAHHRLAAKLLRSLLRDAPPNLSVYCWGYADREFFDLDLSELGVRVFRLEAGLLGYGAPENGDVVSYVIDSSAPYFDSGQPTDLERLLARSRSGAWRERPETRAFVEWARASWFQKYASVDRASDTALTRSDVVVVGQVTGDMALQAAEKSVDGNIELVERAVAEAANGARVFYKPHPLNALNETEIEAIRRQCPQVELLGDEISFADIAYARPKVVVMTSGAGLEAALRGCEVVCYGAAYYAGWGATEDRVITPRRNNRLTADDIFFVTTHDYTRYFERESLETLTGLDLLARFGGGRILERQVALQTARANAARIAAHATPQPAVVSVETPAEIGAPDRVTH